MVQLRLSCSNRVFGCMKGAADGGLDVPHNEKRFPGYDRDTKSYDVSWTLSQSGLGCALICSGVVGAAFEGSSWLVVKVKREMVVVPRHGGMSRKGVPSVLRGCSIRVEVLRMYHT